MVKCAVLYRSVGAVLVLIFPWALINYLCLLLRMTNATPDLRLPFQP